MIRDIKRFLALVVFATLCSVAAASAQQEVFQVSANAGQPTFVNFHFYLDSDCTVTLPSIEFVSVPEGGRVWTVIGDHVVRSSDLTYGGADQCEGQTIQVLYVAYQPAWDAAGSSVEIVYDRILDEGDARWIVGVEIK